MATIRSVSSKAARPWTHPDWPERIEAWINDQLAALRIRRTGQTEHARVRPWSSVLLVPSAAGLLRVKTTAPSMANDAGITALLSALAPDAVLQPLAVDVSARLMLLPEGGPVLRDRMEALPELAHWERILPRMAELQVAAAPLAADLLAAGALDRRLGSLPAAFSDLLDRLDELPDAGDDRLRPDERELVSRAVHPFADACRELAGYGISDSVQHDDFHAGNILLAPRGSPFGYRFVDWGDAYLGPPFAVLLVAMRGVEDHFGLTAASRELRRLEDAYLEPWTGIAPLAELRRAATLARRVGGVPRLLAWDAALRGASEAERAQWAYAPPAWLREIAVEWAAKRPAATGPRTATGPGTRKAPASRPARDQPR